MKNRDKYEECSLSIHEEDGVVFVIEHGMDKDEVVAHLKPVFDETPAELYDRWLEAEIKEEQTIIFPSIPRVKREYDD